MPYACSNGRRRERTNLGVALLGSISRLEDGARNITSPTVQIRFPASAVRVLELDRMDPEVTFVRVDDETVQIAAVGQVLSSEFRHTDGKLSLSFAHTDDITKKDRDVQLYIYAPEGVIVSISPRFRGVFCDSGKT